MNDKEITEALGLMGQQQYDYILKLLEKARAKEREKIKNKVLLVLAKWELAKWYIEEMRKELAKGDDNSPQTKPVDIDASDALNISGLTPVVDVRMRDKTGDTRKGKEVKG